MLLVTSYKCSLLCYTYCSNSGPFQLSRWGSFQERLSNYIGIYCEFMHDGHRFLPACKTVPTSYVYIYIYEAVGERLLPR